MKIKCIILMLIAAVALLGCKPQDSNSGSVPSAPTETPSAPAVPATNAPAPQP